MTRKIDRLSLSLSDLWCNTKHIGHTGAFCLNAEKIFQGGNHVWDIDVGVEFIVLKYKFYYIFHVICTLIFNHLFNLS